MKLRFREENRDIFEAIRDGRKSVETRAATEKYRGIKEGDIVVFACGDSRFNRRLGKVSVFRNLDALLRRYPIKRINSGIRTAKDLKALYWSFPGYREKIAKFGLIAMEIQPTTAADAQQKAPPAARPSASASKPGRKRVAK